MDHNRSPLYNLISNGNKDVNIQHTKNLLMWIFFLFLIKYPFLCILSDNLKHVDRHILHPLCPIGVCITSTIYIQQILLCLCTGSEVSIIVQMCMVLLSEKFLVENDEQHHVMTFVYRRLILVLMDAVKMKKWLSVCS